MKNLISIHFIIYIFLQANKIRGGCEHCEKCVLGACTKCQHGYHVSLGDCSKCSDECDDCSVFATNCESCKNGYYLDSHSCKECIMDVNHVLI